MTEKKQSQCSTCLYEKTCTTKTKDLKGICIDWKQKKKASKS